MQKLTRCRIEIHENKTTEGPDNELRKRPGTEHIIWTWYSDICHSCSVLHMLLYSHTLYGRQVDMHGI